MENVLELPQDRCGCSRHQDDGAGAGAGELAQDASHEAAEQDEDVPVEGDHLVVAGPDVDQLRPTRHAPERALEDEPVKVIWSQIQAHFDILLSVSFNVEFL